MKEETRICLADLASVLNRLEAALHAEVAEIKEAGGTPTKIAKIQSGIKAVKDSGSMLLIWADYVARGDLADPADQEPGFGPDPNPR